MKIMVKKYQPKDMFFNNGIVNLYQFLEDKNLEIEIEFNSSSLVLGMDVQKSEEIYFQIVREGLLKDLKVVHQTDNSRWFFDEKSQTFKMDKKFDTKGGHKNDARNGILEWIEPTISDKELFNRLVTFGDNYNFDIFKKNQNLSYEPIFKKDGSPLKKNIKLVKHITIDEAINNFYDYITDNQEVGLNSKIHSFEDGQSPFHDMIPGKKQIKSSTKKIKSSSIKSINKWEALIYWFGGRVQRFYNYDYFIYPNSSNLKALEKFKEFLNIDDENVKIRDKKGDLKTIGTNIDFYKRLSADGIHNKNFYISNSEAEFEVKFFMYLFSIIYHIEEQYEKANRRRKATKKEIYDALQQITFVVYTDDGTFKTSFNEYTKAYQLIKFFEVLKESELFDYLANILVVFSKSQGDKEVNLNLQRWCQKLLNFSTLREVYYLTSFNILKNDSKSWSFGKKLFEFEKLYLKKLLGEKDMNIHEQSKKLGDGIGHYCAELGDKDLLFKLRNVKNYKQLIAYFKDLKFSILKNEDKAKFSKEFNESLSETLEDIEPNWEIVRDYIAIYAIDKYRCQIK
jgi:hypothetical protein